MSRTQAIKTISRADRKAISNVNGVTLDVVATFTPKMVRMADDGSRED